MKIQTKMTKIPNFKQEIPDKMLELFKSIFSQNVPETNYGMDWEVIEDILVNNLHPVDIMKKYTSRLNDPKGITEKTRKETLKELLNKVEELL